MSERTFREAELYPPVKAWLESQGYAVFAEMRGHDVVAYKEEHIVAVELKMSLTHGLYFQCIRARFADAVYAAVATRPRNIEPFVKSQIGILRVRDSVEVISEPPPVRERGRSPKHRAAMIESLKGWQPLPDRVGGMPTLAGVGPRIDCSARVIEYLKQNPTAGWKEIYRDVPNHYAHYRSMRGALPGIEYLRNPEAFKNVG